MGHTVDGNDFEQDDLSPDDVEKGHLVPDCQYITNGLPAIPCARDLEDYFRLWTPGVSALLAAAPTNYTVQIVLTGPGQIRIFEAYEADGGTNYLFDEATASNQVADSASLYVGLLSSNTPIVLNGLGTEHFIFCGAQVGSAQLGLQVLDGNSNTVADAVTYLQINDIKQMYERFTVGDVPTNTPLTVAVRDASDLPTNPAVSAFEYPYPQTTNTPYILLVHGWNMQRWEKDRFAETAYKRLYWQGYKGRFGIYRWPTGNGFDGSFANILFDARNYDNSEFTAWRSSVGLTNLLTQLNAEYPSHVYVMAHSMGNIVAGEAMLRASSRLANTYIAMQGAVPSHAYDQSAPGRAIVPIVGIIGIDDGTPNCYSNYYTAGAPCYFNATAGAGKYINFYNTNDYALTKWTIDQNCKPDYETSPAYHYSTSSGFYKITGTGAGSTTYLSFPGDTYEIFAYADEARCYAIGAQADLSGPFVGNELDLHSVWPADWHPGKDYSAHVWHSGEFRDDFPHQANFWNNILGRLGFNLK